MGDLAQTRGGLPTDYDPEKGLKKMAVAEAAEIYFARAKDGTKLYEAMEAKLGEQRRFVLWWDEQEKQQGARTQRGNRPVTPLLGEMGLEKMVVSRWRKRLKDPHKFDEALELAAGRCVKIAEFQQGGAHTKSVNTGENEWYTPAQYLTLARDVLGEIDLDPASSAQAQKHVKAAKFFSKEDDGLAQEWRGRIWLNPPYAQPLIADFVSKMVAERQAGRVTAAIMLTHNYTDTAWFHKAAGIADAICFTRGRVKFYDAKGTIAAPTQGQAFFYFGGKVDLFFEHFGEIGFVVGPM